MTLQSVIIPLTPERPATLPAYVGREAHAWFLDRVMARDHRMARILHEGNALKPFTVSNLLGEPGPQEDGWRVHPQGRYALRLTSFDATLSSFLLGELLPNLPDHVILAGVPFYRGRVVYAAEETPIAAWQRWVGASSFEMLVAQHMMQPRQPTGFRLRFAAPTVFRSNKAYVPLPLPQLLVQSLVRRWNAFADIPLHPQVVDFAEQHVLVSQYRLHTEQVRFRKGGRESVTPGFKGRCRYRFRKHDGYHTGAILALAAFAFYAGVGKQTTMGMGQVRG